jgi:hypothetical protein
MVNIGVGVCLKFVAGKTTYQKAKTVCQRIGGNLIRLDSQEKFEMFERFVKCEYNCSGFLIITFILQIVFCVATDIDHDEASIYRNSGPTTINCE